MKAVVQGRREGKKQVICGKVKGEGVFLNLFQNTRGKRLKGKGGKCKAHKKSYCGRQSNLLLEFTAAVSPHLTFKD